MVLGHHQVADVVLVVHGRVQRIHDLLAARLVPLPLEAQAVQRLEAHPGDDRVGEQAVDDVLGDLAVARKGGDHRRALYRCDQLILQLAGLVETGAVFHPEGEEVRHHREEQ